MEFGREEEWRNGVEVAEVGGGGGLRGGRDGWKGSSGRKRQDHGVGENWMERDGQAALRSEERRWRRWKRGAVRPTVVVEDGGGGGGRDPSPQMWVPNVADVLRGVRVGLRT